MHTMETKSIRPFIGAKHYGLSRSFYRDLGFEERRISDTLSLFLMGKTSFYLQDAYVKDWVDNTMLFLEVSDVEGFYHAVRAIDLPSKYEQVRVVPIRHHDWGQEFFIHDPSGILWHVGQFNS